MIKVACKVWRKPCLIKCDGCQTCACCEFLLPFGINNLVSVPRALRVDFDCELSTNHKKNATRRLRTLHVSPFTASIKRLSAARVDRLSFLAIGQVK